MPGDPNDRFPFLINPQLLAMENESMLGPLEKEQRKRLWLLGSLREYSPGFHFLLLSTTNESLPPFTPSK